LLIERLVRLNLNYYQIIVKMFFSLSFPYFRTPRNDLVSKIVIKGNTKEFLERNGTEMCYANGKQIHIDYCRSYFQQVNGKNAALIDDSNVLLIDDDVQNIRLARTSGHHAFPVENNMKLADLYNFLKDRVESYI